MLHPLLNEAFDDLLTAWRDHQERRSGQAPVAALAETRLRLDAQRERVFRLRRALNPLEDEVEMANVATPCPTLGTVVVLYADDGYRCLCGHTLESAVAT